MQIYLDFYVLLILRVANLRHACIFAPSALTSSLYLYLPNLSIFSPSRLTKWANQMLSESYDVSDLGSMNLSLGTSFLDNPNRVVLHQKPLIQRIISMANMRSTNTMKTALPVSYRLYNAIMSLMEPQESSMKTVM